jgi:hypothetical protein
MKRSWGIASPGSYSVFRLYWNNHKPPLAKVFGPTFLQKGRFYIHDDVLLYDLAIGIFPDK